jgi:hypothetical protein
MDKHRKIRQLWRELKQMRRNNQQEESLYFAYQYNLFLVANEEPMLEDQNAVLDQINEDH